MLPPEKTAWIYERARAAGFELCGVVRVDADKPFPELERLPEWLDRGYAGEMNYLRDPRRADPRTILDGARSIIVVGINYNSAPGAPDFPSASADGSPRGWISRYAWGDDYHDVIQQKLQSLIAEMRAEFAGEFKARCWTDTGPIIERVAAKYAGLGWLAKNTFLINSKLGSWLFLGVILTTLELSPSVVAGAEPPADRCGTCTRCLDACPTDAFPAPYVMDSRKCISYLTIELRGSIPEQLRAQMGNAVIGCDICQDVCPWNRKAPITPLPAFQPRQIAAEHAKSLASPELEWLASLSQQEFSAIFRGSAVKRAKWRGLVRNACVAFGNSKLRPGEEAHTRAIKLLGTLAASADALVSEHAQWALQRLSRSETLESSPPLENSRVSGDTN